MSSKTDVRLTPSQRLGRGLKYSAVGPVDVTRGTVGLTLQGAQSAAGRVRRRLDKSRLAKEFGGCAGDHRAGTRRGAGGSREPAPGHRRRT